jgi:hypothetical protein
MRSIFFVLLATDRIVKVIEVSGVQVIAKNAGILLTAYQSTDVAGSAGLGFSSVGATE